MPSPLSLLRLRALPWWVLLELAMAANTQWRELTESDRERAGRLLVKSRGWPGNLTQRERDDLKRVAAQIDVKRLALDMVPKVGRRAIR